MKRNQLILSSGADGSFRDLFVFLDPPAWHTNDLGVQGGAGAAEARLGEVGLGQQFNAVTSHHHVSISHWTNPPVHYNQSALPPFRVGAWIDTSEPALRCAWGAGNALGLLLLSSWLPWNFKKPPLLCNLGPTKSDKCVWMCVCWLTECARWHCSEMGGGCRRALPPVAIQAPRSSPCRVPAAPACNNKEEITAAKGDVIPLMFFQRRRILCVLTSKWSNCFCKMIFL